MTCSGKPLRASDAASGSRPLTAPIARPGSARTDGGSVHATTYRIPTYPSPPRRNLDGWASNEIAFVHFNVELRTETTTFKLLLNCLRKAKFYCKNEEGKNDLDDRAALRKARRLRAPVRARGAEGGPGAGAGGCPISPPFPPSFLLPPSFLPPSLLPPPSFLSPLPFFLPPASSPRPPRSSLLITWRSIWLP